MVNTALITGGARRIGREIARYLFEKHWKIALHYHTSKSAAEETACYINRNGGECFLFPCDLRDTAALRELIPRVLQTFRSCSLLINNASVFERASLNDTDEALFDRQFGLNFKAPFFLSQSFARQCGSGQIINLIDTAVRQNHTSHCAYTLSKKTLRDFTAMAALELGPKIRVNGICPGLILPQEDDDKTFFARRGEKIPLQQTGDPSCITSAVGFLLENPFITGECINVDGGEHLL